MSTPTQRCEYPRTLFGEQGSVPGIPASYGKELCRMNRGGDHPTSVHVDLLKHELQRELYLARSFRFEDMVEGRRTDIRVGQSEVRAVQDIKQLRSELELRRFCHLEILQGSEIPVSITRSDIHVAAFRAKLPRV